MYTVLLVIHVMVTLALIGIILVQRNAGDMGLSGSSSSTSFMSGRSAANLVTRTTAVLATIFILSSLALGIITTRGGHSGGSIMDNAPLTSDSPVPTTKVIIPEKTPAAPAKPAQPLVPRPTE